MDFPGTSTRDQAAATSPARQAPTGLSQQLLYTATETDSIVPTPKAGLWGWETLGILSQWEGSTSLSLEQQVKDIAVSLS